jgi:hypothetical protein
MLKTWRLTKITWNKFHFDGKNPVWTYFFWVWMHFFRDEGHWSSFWCMTKPLQSIPLAFDPCIHNLWTLKTSSYAYVPNKDVEVGACDYISNWLLVEGAAILIAKPVHNGIKLNNSWQICEWKSIINFAQWTIKGCWPYTPNLKHSSIVTIWEGLSKSV